MFRRLYQRFVPLRIRRAVRRFLRELPIRIIDTPRDLRDLAARMPLPPARLRAGVGINSSRMHFLEVGRRGAEDIRDILASNGFAIAGRWLDFGCGSGRVARHFSQVDGVAISGVDVDARAIRWAAGHLPGDYRATNPDPPLPFADATFDVVYCVSVFTHFDEAAQLRWLAELKRVLKPGGALVASTHAPSLVYNRPDLTREHHEALAASGFTFIAGTTGFNDDSAFHTLAYLQRTWSRSFTFVEHRAAGLTGYQDLALWRA